MLWGGCLDSSDSSLRIWPGHRSGFLSTSVQPDFHCLSPSEVFQPFPSCLPFTQPNKVQVQPENRQQLAFQHIPSPPSPKEIELMGMGPTASPQCYMLCNRAGGGTCPQRGLGAVKDNQRLIPASCWEQAMFATDVGTHWHVPRSSFCRSLPQDTGACESHCWRSLYVIYSESWYLKWHVAFTAEL